jgi:ADP-L-glycero-D-manno-heptose 6-epimerase
VKEGRVHVVTGGAGFIGSNLVRELNSRGIDDILVVDDLSDGDRFRNLEGALICDYMDVSELRDRIEAEKLDLPAEAVYHNGACADTMESDGRYMMDNNFTYSKMLLEWAITREVPFVYASSASVYGTNRQTSEEPANEQPLNVYAFSKWVFDRYARKAMHRARSTVAGLRYFNVYGPHEAHKGRMASMVYQIYRQLVDSGVARLFKGTDGFADGGQMRDFVHVSDVAKVAIRFAQGPVRKGVFNVGTGRARSFNDVARAIIAVLGYGSIEYIPFPEELKGKYQSFTEADLSRLREAGYDGGFLTLEEGIRRSVEAWQGEGA